MQFLSYNLLKHKAVAEIELLTERYEPDAFCLQEVDVAKLPNSIGPLELAIGTKKNRLGLAIYVDITKYGIDDVASFRLRDAHYDRLAAPAHERLLGLRAHDLATGDKFSVGSFHASPLTALNAIRREQIRDGLEKLNELGEDSPLIMLGDFNYPIFRKRLESEVRASGYDLLTSNEQTYKNYKFVKGYFDFAVTKDFSVKWLRTLKQGVSDHLPILARAELANKAT